jgi:hypothetical protein
MALTMTRTRTQTALTKLAERVANVHGELAYLEGRLAAAALEESRREAFAKRRRELLEAREALYLTLRQFDPRLDPASIGTLADWIRPFGRGRVAAKRYEAALQSSTSKGIPVIPTSPCS